MSELLGSVALAVFVFFAVRRARFAHHGGTHEMSPTIFSEPKQTSDPEPRKRHRKMSHLPRLVRYIATGTGPYEPAK